MENGGGVMDLQALNNLSYGMYIVTTRKESKNVGCLINSAMQITSKNPIIAISLNKENYTNEVLKETRECALSILSEKTNPEVISKFGFLSSSETNKFENRNFWLTGYYVSMVGLNTETIQKYIREQDQSKYKINTKE